MVWQSYIKSIHPAQLFILAMRTLTRRDFLKSATALAAATPYVSPLNALSQAERKFKLCLNPGAIGVSTDQKGLLEMAIDYGFEAIIAMPEQLAEYEAGELENFVARMKSSGISWGSSGLPVDFRKDEGAFKQGIEKLSIQAKALEHAGVERMNTWVMPSHDLLTYRQNFERHALRLGECADILSDHGVRLGLEYVGPKTLMNRSRYPFMRTLAETRELIDYMGRPNVGVVLDSFHWYCAEDTYEDILALSPEDIVTVDLNDARSDLSRDEQIDGTRELPLATEVIDLKKFLDALVEISYDGPVRAEPFNKALNEMENEEAVRTTHNAMRAAFKLIDK